MPSIEPVWTSRTLIVADDLTGACDAAVAFAEREASTEVLLDSFAADSAAEVCAVVTESRDVTEEEAVGQIAQVVERLRTGHYGEVGQIFKKIDSVFRGNTLREIHAAIHGFPGHFAVIAPAYPALGRTCAEGVLRVKDLAGERTLALREGLDAVGIRPQWLRAGGNRQHLEHQMREAIASGERTVFCDAVEDRDLDLVVQAAGALGEPILWIGSAGLAHALAENLYPSSRGEVEPSVSQGTVLAFVGSDHPVSQAQMALLRETVEVRADGSPQAARAAKEHAVILFAVQRGVTSEREIRERTAGFMRQTIGCLFMTGGDTALAVCRALGIQALSLHHQFAPGIPQGIAVGGPFAGCTVVLKSGGVWRGRCHQPDCATFLWIRSRKIS